MEQPKDQQSTGDAYEDFLKDISNQFARRDEEKEFVDVQVNVGERVKAVRASRGLSREDISLRTSIPVSHLEEIEEGSVAPPLGTVIKLARALEMKMGYFISGDEERAYTVVRRKDRKVVSRYDSKTGKHYGYEYESLAPHKTDRHMEPFLVTLKPAKTEEERSTHDGQEFIYVLQGTMEVRLNEETLLLEPGDAIYYDSTVPHLVKCHGQRQTTILAVIYAER